MASNDRVAELRRFLQCPVCLEQSCDHRALPCLHSFCKNCLSRHMAVQGRSGEFPCPLCKKQFPVPNEGAAGFQHNFFHASLCELVSNSVSIDQMNCSSHEDRGLEIYCEQCKVPICSRCTTSSHKGHELKDLDDAAKNAVDVMRDLLKPWRDVTQHWETLCGKRKQVLKKISQQQKNCKSQIIRVYNELLAEFNCLVKAHVKEAIAQLNEQVQAAREQAVAACDEAELNRGKFTSVLEYVNNVLESCHDAKKLQQFNEIKSLLENLNVGNIETQVKQTVFEIQPQTITCAHLDIPVDIVTKTEDENISSEFSQKFTSVVAVTCESPVHRVTRQPAVKEHAQLERRFSSLLEGEEVGCCWGLAVGDVGLIVADRENENVKVIDMNDFTFKFTLNQTQHQLQDPVDVTCNKLGHIFNTDDGIHGVVKYNAAGRLVKIYPGLYEDEGYITCHNDQLIVADRQGGRVMFTDYNCKVHHQIDARSLGLSEFSPLYVCVDEKSGHLVVGQWEPERVYVINHTQSAVIHTYSDKLGLPYGVCVDPFGHILVADYADDQVILLTPERTQVIIPRGDVSRPKAICTSCSGQVAVLELEGDIKIFKYLDM